MLYAGSDNGVYRITGVSGPTESEAEKVLDAEQVFRVCRFDALDGLFATAKSGLYHSPDGGEWVELPVPEQGVYAVTADPSGDRLYAGTRPSRVYVADCDGGVPTDQAAWRELAGFRELRERADWGIPRHDGVSQVRSLRTHPDEPSRLVAGVEVGGVHVSEDGGESWTDRHVEGFDAPHTDDIHHVALADADTLVASTGSGLYRSTDVGRTWERLDEGHRQRYFRGAFVHDGVVYAGGAPASSSSWEEDPDHALFESRDRGTLDAVSSPVADEVPLGWCAAGGDVLAATHRGSLLRRESAGWERVGSVPTSDDVSGRYLPLEWIEE